MPDIDKAIAAQMSNIEARTGKSIDELKSLVRNSGLSKHGEMVTLLKTTLGMGHGDANLVAHLARKSDEPAVDGPSSTEEVLDGLYTGAKAALRPIHEKLLAKIRKFGDFDEAPKKTYVSYRRKKQFAMIGPATNTRVEVGLNMKGLPATDRLVQLPAGQMCSYRVKLTDVKDVDAELIAWIKTAYDSAE